MHDWESRRNLGGELKRFTVAANLFCFCPFGGHSQRAISSRAGNRAGLPETIEAIESARITTRSCS